MEIQEKEVKSEKMSKNLTNAQESWLISNKGDKVRGKKLAKRTGVKEGTLCTWIRRSEIDTVKEGGKRFIVLNDRFFDKVKNYFPRESGVKEVSKNIPLSVRIDNLIAELEEVKLSIEGMEEIKELMKII